MRTDLPWNVAGIPPEAREAARAAARREGLSVGEWLTRRILRSFSDLGEEAPTAMADRWNIPPGLSRRDTEEMLAHVTRSESANSDLARRVEDQLRGVARRLDSAERSQSENTRAMSRAAAEINVAAREQSQAFEQLGSHVMSLSERLARVERHTADTGMKDAVKGLHLGLSRLADQITQTANQSATQISTVVENLEQLAAGLNQTRQETEYVSRALNDRLGAVERAAEVNANALERVVAAFEERSEITVSDQSATAAAISSLQEQINILESRLADNDGATAIEGLRENIAALENRLADTGVIEKIQSNLSVLEERGSSTSTAVEKLQDKISAIESHLADTSAAADKLQDGVVQLEDRLTDNSSAVAIAKLQHNINLLESRLSDPAAERRLAGLEKTLTDLISRFERERTNTSVEDTIRHLSQKIDRVEKRHDDAVGELRGAVGSASSRLAAVETNSQAFAVPVDSITEPNAFEHGATPEPSSFEEEDTEFMSSQTAENPFVTSDFEAPESFEAAPFGEEGLQGEQPESDGPFAPMQEDAPATVESYLDAARQSARAAAASAEAEHMRGSLGGFSWAGNQQDTSEEDIKRSRLKYLLLALLGGVIVVALIVSLLLSRKQESAAVQRPVVPAPKAQAAASGVVVARPAAPAPNADNIDGTITAKRDTQTGTMAAQGPEQSSATSGSATTSQTASAASKPAQSTTALDRLTALANNGNATAEAIVGFRYLEGDGVAASPVQAAKWLERAAEQGQAVAQSALGQMYEEGQGVAKDPIKAVRWYQAAAAQGNRKAMHNLALTYVNGIGQKKDATEGVRWFLRAASLGVADSQFNLAVLYESGLGVSQSLLEAYKWYLISAAQGDKESKARVEALRTQLSADDRAAAERSAAGFRASPINPKANNIPRLSDLPTN